MGLRVEIGKTFGSGLFERPLFHCYPGGLRFELAKEGTAIQRFLGAHHTALLVAQDAFRGEDHVALCLRARTRVGRGFECRELLRELAAAQIPIPSQRTLWTDAVRPDDRAGDDEPQVDLTLAFRVPVGLLSNVLWCAFATELGIRPALHCAVYLLNLEAGVALFPYDDRGMDVVGPGRHTLQMLHARHHSRLLPHDLPAMQRTFGVI